MIRHQQYDHKCDVYSYGMLLWEVLHRQVAHPSAEYRPPPEKVARTSTDSPPLRRGSRQVPFRTHSPLQAAYAVAMERERPQVTLKGHLAPFASVR